MDQINGLLQENLGIITVAMEMIVLVVLAVLIHKIRALRARVEQIVGKVEAYLNVIMEPESENGENASKSDESARNSNRLNEEEQNRLISAVLQEIFP